jgi:hypothetical protein
MFTRQQAATGICSAKRTDRGCVRSTSRSASQEWSPRIFPEFVWWRSAAAGAAHTAALRRRLDIRDTVPIPNRDKSALRRECIRQPDPCKVQAAAPPYQD